MKWLQVIGQLLTALLSLLKPDVAKKALDAAFDAIEDAVAESENKVDDVIVLPIIAKCRELLAIPDEGKYADKK